MVDPISILGLTSTVIPQLAKTVNFLLQLSTKLKYVDVKVSLLIGYLAGLNVAISEIASIVKGVSGRIQYQDLADSLATTLGCTRTSLLFLESKLDGLQSDSESGRGMIDKLALLLKEAEFEEYVKGVSTYVNALNLLLNVLQSRSLLEQQGILNNEEAQSIVTAMEDETSSLFCVADRRSILSSQTKLSETSAALDVMFRFDVELLRSKPYVGTYRSHLRQAIASGRQGESSDVRNNEVSRNPTEVPSHPITPSLRLDEGLEPGPNELDENKLKSPILIPSPWSALRERLPRRKPQGKSSISVARNKKTGRTLVSEDVPSIPVPLPVKTLLLGSSESGKTTMLRSFKLFAEGPYTDSERKSFSGIIFYNVYWSVRAVLEAMESRNIPFRTALMECHALTVSQPVDLDGLAEAISNLKRDEGFQACLKQRREYQLNDNVDFYLQSLDRICSRDYLPTDKDILHARVKTTQPSGTLFSIKDDSKGKMMDLWVWDVGGLRSEREKWISVFEDADMILFTVDIACYDQLLYEDYTVNRMSEAFVLFDAIVNSRWFVNTEIVLCFTKQAKLAEKIKHSPVENYFPGFVPSLPPRLGDTTQYFINYFQEINRSESKEIQTMVFWDFPVVEDFKAIMNIARSAGESREARARFVPRKKPIDSVKE